MSYAYDLLEADSFDELDAFDDFDLAYDEDDLGFEDDEFLGRAWGWLTLRICLATG